jgi:hypothetical protein
MSIVNTMRGLVKLASQFRPSVVWNGIVFNKIGQLASQSFLKAFGSTWENNSQSLDRKPQVRTMIFKYIVPVFARIRELE